MSTPKCKVYLIASGNTLSADLHHTYRFASATEQKNYFLDGTHKSYNPMQYVRVTEGVVKLPIPKDEIEGRFSYIGIETIEPFDDNVSRMWYGFIVNLEYVSDMCTAVYYEIDPIQTFIFGDGGAQLNWASVERCHSNTDTAGDNRVSEPFSVNATELNTNGVDYYYPTLYLVIGIANGTHIEIPSLSINRDTVAQYYYNGYLATGAEYFAFSSSQHAQIIELLDSISDANTIVDFYICPLVCLPSYSYIVGTGLPEQTANKQTNLMAVDNTNGICGYLPKNKKLYTYPYTKLEVATTVGDKVDLKFEEFNDPLAIHDFSIQGSWAGSPTLICVPRNYAGSYNFGTQNPNANNYDYQVALNGFPICGYNSDLYKIWKAQKELPEKMQMINHAFGAANEGMIKGAVGTYLGSQIGDAKLVKQGLGQAIGGIASGLNSFAQSYGDLRAHEMEAKLQPERQIQSASGDNLLAMSHNHFGFIFYRKTIKAYEAKLIDNYFTQYGYAQNELMNIDTWVRTKIRDRFKYIKTTDLHVNGACPAYYKEEIEAIFNRGITFWEKGQTIGNYDVDTYPNNPVT